MRTNMEHAGEPVKRRSLVGPVSDPKATFKVGPWTGGMCEKAVFRRRLRRFRSFI
jgi:hypothetical protein